MISVTFVSPDGTRRHAQAPEGESVMRLAVAQGIDEILGECGGSMMCATCHCHVDAAWQDITGPRQDGEDDLLDCAAAEVDERSRLSCQIKLTPEMDGLVIHLPEQQT